MSRAASVAVGLLGELVAPTRCVACDELVAPRVLFCGACVLSAVRADKRPRELAVFAYGGAVAAAIVRFKYAGRFDLAPRFGTVMAQLAAPLLGEVDLVVHVPLHSLRLVERGFDQASLLARPIARALGVSHAPSALVRIRATPRQASLARAAREANVAAAFRCPSPPRIAGKRVLLVDDVRTTGATLASCAEALTKVGAASVLGLVLARRDRDETLETP